MESRKRTHVAMIPSPGMGHVIPMAELAKLLLRAHGISTTMVVPTDNPPSEAMKSVLSSLPPEITHQFLPQVSFDDLPAINSKIEARITLTVARSLPHLRSAVKSLAGDPNLHLAAIVVDLFATDALDLAAEFSISGHVFFPSTATALSLFLHLPELDAAVPSGVEFRDLKDPVTLPGLLPIPGSELLDPLQDRRDDAYKYTMHNARRYVLADSIIQNSFQELEPHAIGALLKRESPPRVFPVGPLINKDPVVSDPFACLPWLDSQPPGSVLFVSFGSGGTLSSAQVAELAAGLEKSEQRFLWVVRRPNDALANATYFSVASTGHGKSLDFLPEGFMERTGGRGKVVYSWAPQAQILGHAATGGFLTHCGWNSTLESVASGVPLITWPLFAEQKMNAFMLEREAKVAMRALKSATSGLVEADEVARVAKALIEGEEGKSLRTKMRELKDAASVALSPNGASTKALASLARQWNDHHNKTVV